MADVNKPTASQPTGEPTPPAQPQEPTQTPVATPPAAPVPAEPTPPAAPPAPPAPVGEPAPEPPKGKPTKTVPYSRFKQINERLRKTRTELAKARGAAMRGPTEDLDEIRQHPYVQDLELSKAEGQLRQGAREILKNYPELPKPVRRAILRNPRGYVKADTTNVTVGLLDIEEYIQETLEEIEATGQVPTPTQEPQPKPVQVAGTNQPGAVTPSATPAEIQAILAKPVADWTKEECQKMEEFGAPKL